MRTDKDNNIILAGNERQAGNFIISLSQAHVRVTALSKDFSVRLTTAYGVGMMLDLACLCDDTIVIEMICSWLYLMMVTPPDNATMDAVSRIMYQQNIRTARTQDKSMTSYPDADTMTGDVKAVLNALNIHYDERIATALEEDFIANKDYYVADGKEAESDEDVREYLKEHGQI